ncbi:double-CXXCG motif protein [Myxococcus stipitatus]|uniref:SitI6 family double-CXXCG motif immunity protein n=1 Tax=Myxococcus stipitatus TaxID=83455 RepID=UPI003144F0B9
MGRFFWLQEDEGVAASYGGTLNAGHRWGLPGLLNCPSCSKTWAGSGSYFPGVNLMALGDAEREFRKARPEPLAEFLRLRELVVPLAPPRAALQPGSRLGPLVGKCRGRFPDFAWLGDILLAQPHVIGGLQERGVREVEAFPTALLARPGAQSDLLEVQLAHHGQLHADCIPESVAPPCKACGWFGLRRPDEPVLDASTLPSGLDLFRLGNFETMVICTERFLDAVSSIEGDGLTWRELPVRAGRVNPGAARGGGE